MESNILFSGKISPFGGLSNEKQLFQACPSEFRDWQYNEFCKYAESIFFSGASYKNWSWKTQDAIEQLKQLTILRALLRSFESKHEHKIAIAGWMLSEILNEVPKLN